MTILNQVTAADPVRPGHKGGVDSGEINPLYIEQFGGEVEKTFVKESFMRQFFKFRSVRGTDTITNHRMGETQLQKVSRGVRPTDHAPTFDNISVKVDTLVLARSTQWLLDDFLSHIDVRKEIGQEHGKKIGKFFDESFIVQGIKAAQITNVDPAGNLSGGWADANSPTGSTNPANILRTAPEGFTGGDIIVLGAAGDETDPELLERAIQDLCQKKEEKEIPLSDAVILLRHEQYYTLLRNDKLVSTEFSSGNGNYAEGKVLKSNGVRIQAVTRFPKQSQVGQQHFLSNAGNGNAYNVTQADVNCVALFLMPKALLAGEAIPMTTKVHYSEVELQWFIDAYLAYGVTPNRAEAAGGIWKFNPVAA